MKYYLFYVQSCEPKLKAFKTKKELKAFYKKFKPDLDSWLEFYFKSNNVQMLCDFYPEFEI